MQKNENRNSNIEELRKGFRTAFIDGEYNSNLAYRPEFLSNNAAEGKKVLSAIESELLRCDEFAISVAFITNSGIEYSRAVTPQIRQAGNRLSGLAETAYASLLA